MKAFKTARIPLAKLVQISRHMCAWEGCMQSCSMAQSTLPPGWRWLALWSGPVTLKPWHPSCKQDRDAVLCPKHAQLLHYELLKDIGQRLDKTEGEA